MSKIKKTAKGKTEKKSGARPLNEKTGYRVGTLGNTISEAYLKATKHEAAVSAVEEIIKASAKAKGKPTNEEYVHGRAISWIGFLKERDPKRFKDLPKAEKKAAKAEKPKAEVTA